MFGAVTVRQLVVVASLGIVSLASAFAAEMVSIKGSTVNMRSAPSTRSAALWELKKGYPLKVLKRKGGWLQVQDFESDRGWVSAKLTAKTPYHVVKSNSANIRGGPSTRSAIVGKAERGDVLRTLGKKSGWVKVQPASGKAGWVLGKLTWGW
jgi:uncharacterized protein YgiM (DUF1202 family)